MAFGRRKRKRAKSSERGSVGSTSLPPPGDDLKNVIPVRCDLCLIAIGSIAVAEDGIWVYYDSLFKRKYKYLFGKKKLTVDKWCYENLKKMKKNGTLKDYLIRNKIVPKV